jgi:hypothetical protein
LGGSLSFARIGRTSDGASEMGGLTRRCSCQVRADRVLPFGELGAIIGAGTPAGARARRLRYDRRGLAADRQVR